MRINTAQNRLVRDCVYVEHALLTGNDTFDFQSGEMVWRCRASLELFTYSIGTNVQELDL